MYGLKELVHSFGERNDFMLTEFPVIHTNISGCDLGDSGYCRCCTCDESVL